MSIKITSVIQSPETIVDAIEDVSDVATILNRIGYRFLVKMTDKNLSKNIWQTFHGLDEDGKRFVRQLHRAIEEAEGKP